MLVLQLYGLMSLFGIFTMTLLHQGDVLLLAARKTIPTLSQHHWRRARPTLNPSGRFLETLDVGDMLLGRAQGDLASHREELHSPLLLGAASVPPIKIPFLNPFDGLPFWRLPLDYVLLSRQLRRETRIFVMTCIYWVLAFGIYLITRLQRGAGDPEALFGAPPPVGPDIIVPDVPLSVLIPGSVNNAILSLALSMPGSASMQMPGCFVEQTPCQEPTNGPPTFFGSPIGTSTPPRSRSDFSTHSPSSDGDSFMEFNITDEAYPTVDRDQDSNGQQKDTQETGIPPGSSSTQGFPSHVHIAGGMYRRTRIQTTDGLFDATEWSFWTFPDGTNAPAADTVSLCSDDTGIDDLVSSPPSPENRGYEEQSIWPEREAPPHISECSGQVAAVDTTSPDVSMPNLKDDTPAPVGVDFTQSDDISTERESPTGPEGNEQAYEDEDEVEASGFDYSDLPPVTPSKALSQPMIAIVSALHRGELSSIESAAHRQESEGHSTGNLHRDLTDCTKLETHLRLHNINECRTRATTTDLSSEEQDIVSQASLPIDTKAVPPASSADMTSPEVHEVVSLSVAMFQYELEPDDRDLVGNLQPSVTTKAGPEASSTKELPVQNLPAEERAARDPIPARDPYGPAIVSLPSDIWDMEDQLESYERLYASDNDTTIKIPTANHSIPVTASAPSVLRQAWLDAEMGEMERVEYAEEVHSQGDSKEPQEAERALEEHTSSRPIPIPSSNRRTGSDEPMHSMKSDIGGHSTSSAPKPKVIGRWTGQLAKSLEERSPISQASSDEDARRKTTFSNIPNWKEMPDNAGNYLRPPSSTWQRGDGDRSRSRSPVGPSETSTWRGRSRSSSRVRGEDERRPEGEFASMKYGGSGGKEGGRAGEELDWKTICEMKLGNWSDDC